MSDTSFQQLRILWVAVFCNTEINVRLCNPLRLEAPKDSHALCPGTPEYASNRIALWLYTLTTVI